MKRFIALVPLVCAAAATAVLAAAVQDRFDHLTHARLFPTCNGCHAGILAGDQAAPYPAPEKCAQCHDDERMFKVDWKAPARTAANSKFTHRAHAEASGETDCMTCHAGEGPAKWMNVARADPEATCRACHESAAPQKDTLK